MPPKLLVLVFLYCSFSQAEAAEQWLYLFFPADNDVQQSFVRINNRSNEAGTLTITGIDDEGVTSPNTVTLSFAAGQSRNFNSEDLENGNVSKGLTGGLGDGSGNWRLKFESKLDLDVSGLFRNSIGFVNIVHTSADDVRDTSHEVYFFNPGSNQNQVSRLRVVNLSSSNTTFEVSAIDDDGDTGGPITFTVPGNEAFEVSAAELESGGAGLTGSLGDGSGKWRMTVTSSQSAKVLSLLEDPDGNISNLSTAIVPENEQHLINYMLPDDASQQGFIRFINNSNSAATVTIQGIDEAGTTERITLAMGANEAAHLNSGDIENGNPSKGLNGSLGDGAGAWRLVVTADQDIDVVGLFRTNDGFVNIVHNNTNFVAATTHFVPFFNPASNPDQVSTLRLNNPGNTANTFTISGTDDDGDPGAGSFEVTLSDNTSQTVTSASLEGSWGDGDGKWRVDIASTQDSYVQSLLTAPGDLLSNLSNFLPLPGSETDARTESWMINNSETSTTIVDNDGDPALVNVQIVTETTFNSQAVVQVNATGVPNYNHELTQAEVDWLNNRPNTGSDFRGTGGRTTAEAGPVAFGADINYDSNKSCVEGEGQGYWPPGPVCPLDVEHQVYFPDNPTAASSECVLSLDTVGLWVNGVSVYGYSDGMSYNMEDVWTNLAPAFEVYDIDVCHGHAANNDYHHHSYPHCLAEQLGDTGTDHSPVYGFAQDGYPIYGPWQSNGALAESCWLVRDYSASTSAGGCEDGTRSCQLADNADLAQGVVSVSSGPSLTENVTSASGNPILTESGVYFEDYYYSSDCTAQGDAFLDQYNGHDTEDGRGYHYHGTVIDDSENQTLGIDYYPRFPYFLGPSIYGAVDTDGTDWRCTGQSGGGDSGPGEGGPPGMGPPT